MTQFTTTLFGNQVTPDVADQIILVHTADQMPIYASMIAAGMQRRTMQERFTWFTKSLLGRRTAIDNTPDDYDQNTTSIDVDDGSIFIAGSVILFEATREVGLVTAVSGDTLTVTRGVGTVDAAAGSVADDADVRNIGHAAGEGSAAPDAVMESNTEVWNYVQTFRKAVDFTGRALRTETLTQDERASQRMKKFLEMQEDIEQAILFGARGADTVGGRRITTTGGVYEHVTTNVDNVGGAISKARFNEFAQIAFAQGSSRKTMFAGPTVVEAIHEIYEGNLRSRNGETAVGLTIREVLTPYGQIDMIVHRGLRGDFASDAIVLDMPQVELRHTENPRGEGAGKSPATGRLHLREDIQDDDVDGQVDEWFAEIGFGWGNEQQHALLTGVTGAA